MNRFLYGHRYPLKTGNGLSNFGVKISLFSCSIIYEAALSKRNEYYFIQMQYLLVFLGFHHIIDKRRLILTIFFSKWTWVVTMFHRGLPYQQGFSTAESENFCIWFVDNSVRDDQNTLNSGVVSNRPLLFTSSCNCPRLTLLSEYLAIGKKTWE